MKPIPLYRYLDRLRRRLRRPAGPLLIVGEAVTLVLLHFGAVKLLAAASLLEHLLAPGPGSRVAIAITVMFLLLRTVVLVLLPGWFLTRVWWLLSRPAPEHH